MKKAFFTLLLLGVTGVWLSRLNHYVPGLPTTSDPWSAMTMKLRAAHALAYNLTVERSGDRSVTETGRVVYIRGKDPDLLNLLAPGMAQFYENSTSMCDRIGHYGETMFEGKPAIKVPVKMVDAPSPDMWVYIDTGTLLPVGCLKIYPDHKFYMKYENIELR